MRHSLRHAATLVKGAPAFSRRIGSLPGIGPRLRVGAFVQAEKAE